MHGIPVAEPAVPQTVAVIIDRNGSIDDFILSVVIHICHTEVVIPLSRIAGIFAGQIRVECPSVRQYAIPVIPGGQHGSSPAAPRVITPAHHHTGFDSVKIGDTGQKPVHTVTICISPAR